MFWRWFKKYLPRGLYGRAALILVLPVIMLQLLVSVVFIQRHFDGVTRSMTSAVSIEVRFLQQIANELGDLSLTIAAMEEIARPLEINFDLPATDVPSVDNKRWDDLTGRLVIETLRTKVDNIVGVSLMNRHLVRIWIRTDYGPMRLEFNRARVSASNPHQLLVIMVVIGAFMTAIAYFFLRNQLRPIKRMARAAAEFGRGRVVPFTPTGAIEVRAAGTAFLDMRNRIERQSQSRTMMLSGVSHDLRTPLTRLRLGLSMLEGEDVAEMERDVADMERLLDGFLAFARDNTLDTLQLTDPRDVLAAVIQDAHRMKQPVVLSHQTGPIIESNLRPAAIRRALENLIGNALRYGTVAHVALTITDRTIRYTVEDDGPGIAPEDREAAVSPFVRLDPARNQNAGGGVGLGLAIVTDIARSHGGVLRLDKSESLGGLRADLIIAR